MIATATIERAMAESGRPIGHGVFVAVVGPSGAGKDTIIDYARDRLSRRSEFCFARRVVTRTSSPDAEDHDTLGEAEFEAAVGQGAFAIHWQAHDLRYGLPRAIDEEIDRGGVVIANVSRAVLLSLKEVYAHLAVVQIVASQKVLGERLAARGRETPAEVEKRLKRDVSLPDGLGKAIVIDNSGPVHKAGDRFVTVLEKAAAFATVSEQI